MDSTTREPSGNRAIVLAHEPPFRLGQVDVRPSTREVVGPAGRAVLEPRVMQVLVALARAGGGVLTRDDLAESCWEGRVVGEDAISRVISRLRRATEGVGRDGWTLETVTKVGYRLTPVERRADAPTTAAAGSRPDRRAVLAMGAGVLAVTAGGVALLRRATRPDIPPETRALYEKGVEALRQGVPEQMAQAVGFLREAVERSPDYAPAWGALAIAYESTLLYTDPAHQPAVRAQARAAADRALELDPRDPDGATARALLAPTYRNWDAAERLFDRALALHPRHAELEVMYSVFLVNVGRIRAAVQAAQGAVAHDPFAPWNWFALATDLWAAGRVEEAEIALRRGRARWPRHYALWFLEFDILTYTGRADQAIALGEDRARRPVSIPADEIELRLQAARALQTRAPKDVAAAAEAQWTRARRGAGYAENAMIWLAALGRTDDAFRVARGLYLDEGFNVGALRFSADQGRFSAVGQRSTYHLFLPPTASMRADPRFGVLARDIGLGRYWQGAGHGPDDPAWARGSAA